MSKINITILGTAAGVPTRERAHSAIHIEYLGAERFSCLFDCGEGTQRQMLIAGLGLGGIERIFVTHWHGDHCLGIPGLVDTMGFEGREAPLYVHAPESRKMSSRGRLLYPMGKYKVIVKNVPLKRKKVRDVFSGKELSIRAVPVEHSVPAVGYVLEEKDRVSLDMEKIYSAGLSDNTKLLRTIKEKGSCRVKGKTVRLEEVSIIKKGRKIVYSGDTEICEGIRDVSRGADLLIHDCTYLGSSGDYRPHRHASLPEIAEMVEGLGIKKVVLTHFSRKYADMDLVRKEVAKYPGFMAAEDLCKIEI